MAQEIERKFLVNSKDYRLHTQPVHYRQGYIPTLNGMTVRIRIAGDQGFVTFKDHAVGFTRHEFEYLIPLEDAKQMLDLMCSHPQIEKNRYVIPIEQTLPAGTTLEPALQGLHWEVDEFLGDNEGLIVAELEVPTEDTKFPLPSWLGPEVTGDHRYYNSHLCKHPYKEWKSQGGES